MKRQNSFQPDKAYPLRPKFQRRFSEPDPEEAFDAAKFTDVERVDKLKWKRGPLRQMRYKMRVKELPKTKCPLTRLFDVERVVKVAFSKILADAPPGATAQIFAVNPNLNKKCIATERTKVKDLTFHKFAERLCAALQSDDAVKLQETDFYLTTYTNIKVGGWSRSLQNRYLFETTEWAKAKSSMYDPMVGRNRVPKDMENLCVPLIIARELYCLGKPGVNRAKIHNFFRTKVFHDHVRKVVEQSGLENKEGPFTIEQLPSFGKCLPEGVGLNFFEGTAPPFLQLGKKGPQSINIFINYNDDDGETQANYHAFGITSMPAFMGVERYCYYCFKAYFDNGRPHKCTLALCQLCKFGHCKNRGSAKPMMRCKVCLLPFRTEQCLDAHITECDKLTLCELCGDRFQKKSFKKHSCGLPFCSRCAVNHSPFEYCFVQAPKTKPSQPLIWYADMETQVDPNTKEHHANLLVLQNQDNTKSFEYKGADAVQDFVEASIAKGSPFANCYLVFHNGAGFDVHLLWREMWKAGIPPKNIIRKQQKIIALQFNQNNIKCRDSLQFLPGSSLASLPKMFGLESGPKGDFPHGLNTPEWVEFGKRIVYGEVVDGEYHRFPPLKYFWPEMKRTEQLEELESWHKTQVIKFQEDPTLEYIPEDILLSYCRQDVRILREAFECFRKSCLKQYPDLEPLESLTFPSFNNRIFRAKYMAKDSLSLLPPMGYESENQRYSKASMAWIAWKEQQLGLTEVRSARKGGEVRMSGHNVDATGVDASGRRHVLEFHGCYWHGHDCQTRSELMDSRSEETIQAENRLKGLARNPKSPYGAFEYHSTYECQWEEQLRDDPEMMDFVSDYLMKYPEEPLKLRESMRGGRTNVIKHQIKFLKRGWRLMYYDFTSLYPAVNFGINGEVWPIGHPDIYIGKDLENGPSPQSWFGFAKLEMVPPKTLLHPVLGQLVNGKLLFHLCTTCAHLEHQDLCEHSEAERTIHGTFFSGEIHLALEMGYSIRKVHELWHWPKERQSQTLFTEFMRDQYGKKALASAVPKDPTELQNLIAEYRETMGLELKPEEFKENKANRAFAKFCLNNFWGYMAKRENHEQTECVSSLSRWLELEQDPEIEITTVSVSSDEENILVSFKKDREEAGRNGNIAVAAMTTAYARMALYRVIRQYSEHVVYFDTDSVFLHLPPGVEPPPTSTVLGGLKDEILETYGPGAYISSFNSIGPKSYSYRYHSAYLAYVYERVFRVLRGAVLVDEVVKMKGISFTAEASKTVTGEAMEELTEDQELQVIVPQHTIRKNFFQSRLFNASLLKKVRFQSTKRWILPTPEMDTRPYGYSGRLPCSDPSGSS